MVDNTFFIVLITVFFCSNLRCGSEKQEISVSGQVVSDLSSLLLVRKLNIRFVPLLSRKAHFGFRFQQFIGRDSRDSRNSSSESWLFLQVTSAFESGNDARKHVTLETMMSLPPTLLFSDSLFTEVSLPDTQHTVRTWRTLSFLHFSILLVA